MAGLFVSKAVPTALVPSSFLTQFHSHLFGDEQWILAPLKVLD